MGVQEKFLINFTTGLEFGLSKNESNKMFQVGDKRDTEGDRLCRFRKLFDPVER